MGASSLARAIRRALIAPLVLLLARAFVAKARFSNAKFIWLLKRYVAGIFVRILPQPPPEIIRGTGSLSRVAEMLRKARRIKPLIVTDATIAQHGLLQGCISSLRAANMQYEIYDGVVPDPNIDCVEDGFAIYQKGGCDSIVAVGGGSAMDSAKMIGVKAGNPKPVKDYEGVFKCTTLGWKPMTPVIAVPTTAGTGSEVSPGAVIADKHHKRKFVCIDPGMIPSFAILDPELLFKLPASVTAATGMDALTHAIESYLNGIGDSISRKHSLTSTNKIFKYLLKAYHNGSDSQAREGMLDAAFEAGVAISHGHVGNVHAIAHQLGTLFKIAHGTANAMVLPHVLELYLRKDKHHGWCAERLCDLAQAAGFQTGKTKSQAAHNFVASIRDLMTQMDMPFTVSEMRNADVREVALRAMAEAHGNAKPVCSVDYWCDLGYPVPFYMTLADCIEVVAKLLPPDAGSSKKSDGD